MKLMSSDLRSEEKIDPKFTCDGENISPHLKWEDVLEDTKSFALSCIDVDSKAGTWIHWYVVNIPKNIREIVQGGPIPGKELENDFGNIEYGGPCPEKGEHRYFFTLYALNVEQIKNVNKANFDDKVSKIMIESAEIIVRYERG
ncbi:MAG: YbhB/YbcL family Raf kinase inhibitor-like protein [Promethearchaeota archaeon]|nr:MAG: YbhB/YbcL family Raf kinase inhibitor-like protein [Candidatus Lokiarchaeota archaeon]